jgi:hypothetical protein
MQRRLGGLRDTPKSCQSRQACLVSLRCISTLVVVGMQRRLASGRRSPGEGVPESFGKHSSSARRFALAANALAIRGVSPLQSMATAMGVFTTGPTSSTARRSALTSVVHSQVCGTMQALSPLVACASKVLTESVSTCGLTVIPTPAKPHR